MSEAIYSFEAAGGVSVSIFKDHEGLILKLIKGMNESLPIRLTKKEGGIWGLDENGFTALISEGQRFGLDQGAISRIYGHILRTEVQAVLLKAEGTEINELEHINEIEEPRNLGRTVKVKGVVASNSIAYAAPKRVSNGETIEIPCNDEVLLRFINVSEDTKLGLLRKRLGTKEDIREETSWVIYRLRITPPVKSLELLDGKIVDEKGREWKAREIFVVSDRQIEFEPGSVYEFTGKVVADPRNQKITILAWNVKKADEVESIDQNKVKTLVDFFRGKPVSARVRWILKNFGSFSKIVKRENLALAGLLAYFSPIYLKFDGKVVRGWLIVAFIGDSTTGKSETVRSLLRLFGMGTLITGETASTAGLTAAAVQDKGGTWLVDWGFLVLMDLKLLAVDGFHKLSKEQSMSLDESERTGQVILTKAGKNRAYARTRQIKIANPVERLGAFGTKSLSSFLYPAQAVPTIFNDTSIQRLDLVVFADARDVKPEEVNQRLKAEVDPLFFHLKEALKLVWSNRLKVKFTDEVIDAILAKATELTTTFGWSGAKVASIDMKYKLARLSAALANLVLSFNEELTETIVEKEHVEYIAEFIRREYTRAGFHILREKELNEVITPEEAHEILERIASSVFGSKDEVDKVKAIVEFIVEKGRITKDQLASKFHLADKSELRPLISALQNEELIERRNGFYPTDRAIQLVKAFATIATFANPQKEPLGVSMVDRIGGSSTTMANTANVANDCSELLSCPHCTANFASQKDLQAHVQHEHGGEA